MGTDEAMLKKGLAEAQVRQDELAGLDRTIAEAGDDAACQLRRLEYSLEAVNDAWKGHDAERFLLQMQEVCAQAHRECRLYTERKLDDVYFLRSEEAARQARLQDELACLQYDARGE